VTPPPVDWDALSAFTQEVAPAFRWRGHAARQGVRRTVAGTWRTIGCSYGRVPAWVAAAARRSTGEWP
jgi:hypothetical protein